MKRKAALLKVLVLLIGLTSLTGLVMARSGGVSGYSISGATCHEPNPDPGVTVTITGIPASYTPGNSYPLQVSVSGNPPNGGGFDLSVTAGTLTTSDPNAKIMSGEATNANEFARSWSVNWQAPAAGAGTVTFYVAGLASDNDGGRNGDAWNTAVYTSNEASPNSRPTISLTNPTGTQDWTGGSSQTITWTMSDDITPVSSLKVYLNYSSTPSSGTIAGPLTGATSYPWTVPTIDATDARVNATVIDGGGLKGYSQVLIPKIDSTRPTVLSAQPTGTTVALTAPIIVVFSETMDTAATQSAFSIAPNPGGLVYSWSQTTVPNDTMTVNHNAFTQSTPYTATISTAARDVSTPGNTLAPQYQWSFTTATTNTPPTITFTLPTGGDSWTGGTPHDIAWTANDAQDPVSSLKLWVNYSITGTAPYNMQVAGLQGAAASSSPYTWTVAMEDSTTVVLNATIIDTAGARGYALSPIFEIDSTRPTITSVNPPNGAPSVPTNANVLATFSEPMNRPSAESAFTLQDTATWTLVPGAFSWAGNIMTFNPTSLLTPATTYSANFTTAAMDDSLPGNSIASPYVWTFTTSMGADTTPPQLSSLTAIPDPQEVHLMVNVSIEIQDNVAVDLAWLDVTDPLGGSSNTTMALDTVSMRYFVDQPYDIIGIHKAVVWASDTSGNWASMSTQFTMRDTTPPQVSDLTAVPDPVEVYTQTNLSALVSDNYMLAGAWVVVTAPDMTSTNNSMSPGSRYYYNVAPTQLGTYTFQVWASDSVGLWATASSTFVSQDTTPPTAEAGPNQVVPQSTLVTFDASASTDNFGIDNYTWDFTDGDGPHTLYGVAPSYTFVNFTTVLVTLTVTDFATNSDQDTMWVNLTDTLPPTADAGPDQNVAPNTNVTLDGSASTDDVGIVNYEWSFDDGSGPVNLLGMTVNHIFPNTGSFLVTLNVTDVGGNHDEDQAWVNVTDSVPPTADAGPDQTVPQNTQVTLDGTASSDDIGIQTYAWSFDDGDGPVDLTGATAQHTFPNIGDFLVTLTVTDFGGNSDQDQMWVHVTDGIAPTADAGPDQTIDVGQTANLDGSGSTDNVGIVSYSWTFNDGGPVTLTGVQASHQFNTVGDYTVTLTVADQAGHTDTDSMTVHVVATGDTEPPAAPLNLVVQAGGPGALQLTWNANTEPDLAGYRLYRSLTPGGPYVMINPDTLLTSTSYLDENLAGGHTYYYVVTAIDASGNESQRSNEASGFVAEIPIVQGDTGPEDRRWLLIFLGILALLVLLAIWVFFGERKKEKQKDDELQGNMPEP